MIFSVMHACMDLVCNSDVQLTCSVNGEEKQNGRTRDMIFNVPYLISFLSQDTTLLPGTVILT
jgi:2-keto-4-pentenoate hydratase/2-oxohepta-3-ene-1,7-dioic acid hydratase in catechol pathway